MRSTDAEGTDTAPREGLNRMLRITLATGVVALCFPAFGQNVPTRATIPAPMQVPDAVGRAHVVSALPSAQALHLSLSLAPADAAGLEAYANDVSDPSSPNYRKFLTPTQVGARFGLAPVRIQAIQAYLAAQGMKVTLVAPNRLSILVDATAAQAEKAFDTTLAVYHATPLTAADRADFYSYTETPKLPSAFASSVVHIGGLENATKPVPRAITASQTRAIYGAASDYSSGYTGAGRSIAISNFDGYRLTNVAPYYSYNSLPAPSGGIGSNIKVTVCGTASGTGTPQGEGDLDIQMVLGMAPLCNFTIYDGSDLITVLTREVNDNTADVISESYGWNLPASTATAAHNLHLSMTAQGITYMAASGDSGTSFGGYDYPDYEPEVLMVGGTVATATTAGARSSEVGWSGSGGGYSTNAASFNTLPSWQKGTGVPTTINKRLVPDVALNASGSNSGAYPFYFNGSLTTGYVGTSFASPVMAGLIGIAEQKLDALGYFGTGTKRLGRLQDAIYAQNGRSDVWYDVTSGSNGNLPNGTASTAGVGWDSVAGWGAINIDGFIAALRGTTSGGGGGTTPSSTTYYATSATVFSTQGSLASGNAASLKTTDGNDFTVASTKLNGVGTVASCDAIFNLPAGSTGSATINIVANAPSGTTDQVFVYNVSTGNYDLISSTALTGVDKSFTVTLSNVANYVSSAGAMTIVERTIKSSGTYTFKTDLLTVTK